MPGKIAISVLSILLLSAGVLAQEKQTISVRTNRPVSDAIIQLGQRYGWVISYEDPRYEYAGDTEDVTRSVRKDFKPGDEIDDTKRVVVPKVKKITLTFASPSDKQDPESTARVTQLLVDSYRRSDGSTFEVRSIGGRLAIVPIVFRVASGDLQPTTPLLDTVISIPPQERNGAEFLKELCNTLQAQTGVGVMLGMFPQNTFAQYHSKDGHENMPARQILAAFLDGMPNGHRYAWALLFQQGYALNIRWVRDPGKQSLPARRPTPQRHMEEKVSSDKTRVIYIER